MYKKIVLGMVICGLARGSTMAADWNLPGVTIITRAQWGANESLRYSNLSKTERDKLSQKQKDAQMQLLRDSEGGENGDTKLRDELQKRYQLQLASDYLVTAFPNEQSTDEFRESANGKYLKRPESIHYAKKKIIIHHTAEDYTSLLSGGMSAVKTSLQNIYKYHTITKGWGDIGYNFLIDPAGNIYEGRAGGDSVVGAHASWNNTSTVGIALMGNFNIQKPTDEQLQALVKLATALAKKYSINPQEKVSYFKPSDRPPYISTVTSYAVAGHKDDGQATACPGTELYKILPNIRTKIKEGLQGIAFSSASGSKALLTFTGLHYGTLETIVFSLPLAVSSATGCTSLDTGMVVISCSFKNGLLQLGLKRKGFTSNITKSISVKVSSSASSSATWTLSFPLLWKADLDLLGKTAGDRYKTNNSVKFTAPSMNKITSKILLPELKTYLSGKINVLLYDLSMYSESRDVTCQGGCLVGIDDKIIKTNALQVESHDGFLYLLSGEDYLTPQQLVISSVSGGLVTFTSYKRTAYGGIPWNVFRGSVIIKKNPVRNLLSGAIEQKFLWINRLSFSDYMRGIAETSDSDSMTKQTLVLMLAKMYALFYMNPKNIHPSIPAGANYTAIDNPDMFQKYVGAGRERTSKSSAKALDMIQRSVILYSGYVPILPYFSCSAGFTWSAKDKRGWTDTPYLQARIDFAPCFDFRGHGVGLSGKGAQYLAEQGWDLNKILNYYYPGVNLTKI